MPFKIVILVLALVGMPAGASLPPTAPWVCDFQSQLAGVASHYLLYGRDSWTGDARLECNRGIEHQIREVEVTFNSLKDGFGADQSTRLQMDFNMVAYTALPALPVHSVVVNDRVGLPAEWQMQNGTTAAHALITSLDVPGAEKSLKMGTLFIRQKKDTQ